MIDEWRERAAEDYARGQNSYLASAALIAKQDCLAGMKLEAERWHKQISEKISEIRELLTAAGREHRIDDVMIHAMALTALEDVLNGIHPTQTGSSLPGSEVKENRRI